MCDTKCSYVFNVCNKVCVIYYELKKLFNGRFKRIYVHKERSNSLKNLKLQ